jgi:hypothetical protein
MIEMGSSCSSSYCKSEKLGRDPFTCKFWNFVSVPVVCSIKLFLFCFDLFHVFVCNMCCSLLLLLLLLPGFQRKDGFVLNLIQVGVWL